MGWNEVGKERQEWVAAILLAVVNEADKLIAESVSMDLHARKTRLELDRNATVAALERLGYWATGRRLIGIEEDGL